MGSASGLQAFQRRHYPRYYQRQSTYLPPWLFTLIEKRLRLRRRPGHSRTHSIRAISRELRVDRITVRAIDRGAYLHNKPQAGRCETCGHDVVLPCRVCAAMNEKRNSKAALAAA